jgi:hypothetical protein
MNISLKFLCQFLTLLVVNLAGDSCLAEDIASDPLLVSSSDYAIFTKSERRLIGSLVPSYEVAPSQAISSELEYTLREIELLKNSSETETEFVERATRLRVELEEHPELFQEKARNLSASRSRFRSGLLTPLTVNQLEKEIAQEILTLNHLELSKLIRIGDSIFFFRREHDRMAKDKKEDN